MHAQLVAALFLAHKAKVPLDIAPVNALANGLTTAATATEVDPAPCNTAINAINHCIAAISDFNAAPQATQAACLCCQSSTELASVYSSCAASFSKYLPASTSEYTSMAKPHVRPGHRAVLC